MRLFTDCQTCKLLQEQLEKAEMEKNRLLDYILQKPSNDEIVLERNRPVSSLGRIEPDEPIKPKFIPWAVRREMLENEDRQKAILLRKQKEEQDKAIKNLENKTGVSDVQEG